MKYQIFQSTAKSQHSKDIYPMYPDFKTQKILQLQTKLLVVTSPFLLNHTMMTRMTGRRVHSLQEPRNKCAVQFLKANAKQQKQALPSKHISSQLLFHITVTTSIPRITFFRVISTFYILGRIGNCWSLLKASLKLDLSSSETRLARKRDYLIKREAFRLKTWTVIVVFAISIF